MLNKLLVLFQLSVVIAWNNCTNNNFFNFPLTSDICFTEKSPGIRLAGPSSSNGTGRVEIFYNGEWGTICDSYWSINDAKVVCRQLGYRYTISALRGSQVPNGFGRIWLNYVWCTGREQNLTSCYISRWGNNNCRHGQDVGVECSSTGKVKRVLLFIFIQYNSFLAKKNDFYHHS